MVPEPTQWTTGEKAEANSCPKTIGDQASLLSKKPWRQSHTFLRLRILGILRLKSHPRTHRNLTTSKAQTENRVSLRVIQTPQ